MKLHIEKSTLLSLSLLVLGGLFLRLIHFEHTTFAYDQARDAFRALEIWGPDPIKLVGPTTDVVGLFHGALYWYLISPVYYLSTRNPLAVKLLLTILHLGIIPLTYFVTLRLNNKKSTALLAAFFATVSFEATQYAHWLSNPTLALLVLPFFYYGFWLVLHKNHHGLGLMACMLALAIQFQFFFVYLGLFFLIAVGLTLIQGKRTKIFDKTNLIYFGIGFLFLLPFALYEVTYHFQGLHSLLHFIQAGSGERPSYLLKIKSIRFIENLAVNARWNGFGWNTASSQIYLALLGLYTLITAFMYRKTRSLKAFLVMWFISPALIYPVEKNNAYFLHLGNMYPLLILSALSFGEITARFPKAVRYIALGCVVVIVGSVNFQNINTYNSQGDILFSVQKNVDLVTEKEIIDWMYSENPTEQFSFNTITNPLFINTTWAFLFESYALPKYGRLPFWAGDPIDGRYPGGDVQFDTEWFNVGETHYLIIEPQPGVPLEYLPPYKAFENTRSKLVSEKRFGAFLVQKRIITDPIPFSRDTVFRYTLDKVQ